MDVSFANQRLQKLCSSEREMQAKLGAICAKKLRQRLAQMNAAETLDELGMLPQARCHELTGDRRGQLAVDLEHPRRLIFQPDHEPLPVKSDSGLDWPLVTSVRILEIADYH